MKMVSLNRRPNGMPSVFDMFDDLFTSNWPQKSLIEKGIFTPSVNVTESDKNFRLEFAAPGFEKKDFDINIEKDFITVSAKKEMNNEAKEENYTRREFSFESFERTFTLPENVNAEQIEALYENGILNVVLPKKDVQIEKPVKKVEIK